MMLRRTQFLASLDIAKSGAAVIVGPSGNVIASSLSNLKAAALGDAQAGNATIEALRRANEGQIDDEGMVAVEDGGIFYATRTPLDFNGWQLVTAIPRAAFTAEIDRNTQRLLIAVAILALLAAAIAAIFANFSFAQPIACIARELRHIESFSLGEVKHNPSRLAELDSLSAAFKRMAGSLRAFGLYVPTEIVRTLVQQGIEPKPGGEMREITVLFADLPGFTTLTEKHGADVAPFLTEFLTLATQIIHAEGGTVDKFIGDCIMGLWNAPAPCPDHTLCACRAAIAIRDAMQRVRRPDGRNSGPRVRIGINTGHALVGNVGSNERLSYTAIGDVVNVASRHEALGKEFDAEIVMSAVTMRHKLFEQAMKGDVRAYRILEEKFHKFDMLRVQARVRLDFLEFNYTIPYAQQGRQIPDEIYTEIADLRRLVSYGRSTRPFAVTPDSESRREKRRKLLKSMRSTTESTSETAEESTLDAP